MQGKRWRFMLWGGIGVGKSTLLHALQGGRPAGKTQMVEYSGCAIDTPGEYSEMGRLTRHLLATATDAQLLVVVHDATRDSSNFSPGYFQMFNQPVIGVVTKIDAPEADPERAELILHHIGVREDIYRVSAVTGSGLDDLRTALEERKARWQGTTALEAAKLSA
jgi:ethanolamine utilization protein EutP